MEINEYLKKVLENREFIREPANHMQKGWNIMTSILIFKIQNYKINKKRVHSFNY